MLIVFNPIETATTQFGNPCVASGQRIVEAKLIARRSAMVGEVFLVQDGNTFGLATMTHGDEDDVKAEYYCTNAFPISKSYPVEFVARQLGFPVELFKQAA